MITLKLHNYDENEIKQLYELFVNAADEIDYCKCNEQNAHCADCPIRHYCLDINVTREYLEKLLTEHPE